MPYVKQEIRNAVNNGVDLLIQELKTLEHNDIGDMGGNLNYVITRLLTECFPKRQYAEMAKAISVLEMAKMEYYRRVASPHEDQKSFDNGDVYPGAQ